MDIHQILIKRQKEKQMKDNHFIPNMIRCRQFYQQAGAKMIERLFPQHISKIAVGLVGEGSDCFGYDDTISQDHDYETCFCMWLSTDTYQQIGLKLQEAYAELCCQWEAQHSDDISGAIKHDKPFLSLRRGVFSINNFYREVLHCDLPLKGEIPILNSEFWLTIPEEYLAAAVNGSVFRDDEGIFTQIRNHIAAYYPPHIYRLRLARQVHLFSQNGQYNYPRMMARGDLLTSRLCLMQAIKSAMAVTYLLNRKYAPYYKWMRKGMDSLPLLCWLGPALDEAARANPQISAWSNVLYNSFDINQKDCICVLLEKAASMILDELNRQNIVRGTNTFLDLYTSQIAQGE